MSTSQRAFSDLNLYTSHLRNNADKQLVQHGKDAWKNWAPRSVGKVGIEFPMFVDMQGSKLYTTSQKLGDQLRQGQFMTNLDTLPATLHDLALLATSLPDTIGPDMTPMGDPTGHPMEDINKMFQHDPKWRELHEKCVSDGWVFVAGGVALLGGLVAALPAFGAAIAAETAMSIAVGAGTGFVALGGLAAEWVAGENLWEESKQLEKMEHEIILSHPPPGIDINMVLPQGPINPSSPGGFSPPKNTDDQGGSGIDLSAPTHEGSGRNSGHSGQPTIGGPSSPSHPTSGGSGSPGNQPTAPHGGPQGPSGAPQGPNEPFDPSGYPDTPDPTSHPGSQGGGPQQPSGPPSDVPGSHQPSSNPQPNPGPTGQPPTNPTPTPAPNPNPEPTPTPQPEPKPLDPNTDPIASGGGAGGGGIPNDTGRHRPTISAPTSGGGREEPDDTGRLRGRPRT